jgi:hypothetical protein
MCTTDEIANLNSGPEIGGFEISNAERGANWFDQLPKNRRILSDQIPLPLGLLYA